MKFTLLNTRNRTEKTVCAAASALAAVFLIISAVCLLSGRGGARRTFIFPSADAGKYIIETRFLPENPVQGDIGLYVDELLLGSLSERTLLLFTPGTSVLSCFLRDGTLYLDLSDDMLAMGDGVADIKDAVRLLRRNLTDNFREIKEIELFVGGRYAYGNSGPE